MDVYGSWFPDLATAPFSFCSQERYRISICKTFLLEEDFKGALKIITIQESVSLPLVSLRFQIHTPGAFTGTELRKHLLAAAAETIKVAGKGVRLLLGYLYF